MDNYKFNSEDLAIIIPTKDRPLELKRILSSIVELDCKVGRVIVVSSGINVGEVLKKFKNLLQSNIIKVNLDKLNKGI